MISLILVINLWTNFRNFCRCAWFQQKKLTKMSAHKVFNGTITCLAIDKVLEKSRSYWIKISMEKNSLQKSEPYFRSFNDLQSR